MYLAITAVLCFIVGGLGAHWFGLISLVVTVPIGMMIGLVCAELHSRGLIR